MGLEMVVISGQIISREMCGLGIIATSSLNMSQIVSMDEQAVTHLLMGSALYADGDVGLQVGGNSRRGEQRSLSSIDFH